MRPWGGSKNRGHVRAVADGDYDGDAGRTGALMSQVWSAAAGKFLAKRAVAGPKLDGLCVSTGNIVSKQSGNCTPPLSILRPYPGDNRSTNVAKLFDLVHRCLFQ